MIVDWHHGTPITGTSASQNARMEAQTSIATILEFPATRPRASWVPRHACPCTVDDIEFHSLKLIQHFLQCDSPAFDAVVAIVMIRGRQSRNPG
jgi:hypothetical protein